MSVRASFLRYCVVFCALCISAHGQNAPEGFGQLKNPPTIIPGGTDEEGRSFSYLGQLETNQKIILTASNGFFTKGACQAKGESQLPKVGDEELIVPNFEHLDWKEAEGTLRWHLLVQKPGEVRFNVHMDVANGGADIEVNFAGQTIKVSASKSRSDSPQSWDLTFDVEQPGEYMLSLGAAEPGSGSAIGLLHRIDAFGSGIEGANLLRVRWRPAAVHGGYDTAKVENAKLLVFTTRSNCDISSYSPITTPFGYYGTSFDGDRRSNGSFNFSMWGQEQAAFDLKTMPHLLGVGSPEGEFSGFGHEGSGVKPRGWDPMPDRPELVVQALRVVSEDDYDCYYGYYFDHPTNAWKFYGAGKKWHDGKPREHIKLGSFCEIPGPPQNERTGDVYREVRRMGWAHDDGKWIPLEQFSPGGTGSSGDLPVNKSWFTTKDGEYAMGCGGIRLYQHKASLVKAGGGGELPYFLASPTIQNIFSMPVQFGEVQATEVASDSATIEIDVPGGGELKAGAVYFGTQDSLTFAPRELHGTEKNSELSQTILRNAWESVAEISAAHEGVNRVTLDGLKPETTYFYRVLMTNSVSRIWNHESLSFTTPKTGSQPIKLSPLSPAAQPVAAAVPSSTVMKIEGEPFRVWTYKIGGNSREIEGRLIAIANGKIQIELKSDGRKGTMELSAFSESDRAYVESKKND
ncbi:MAG: hypothetical protein ACI8UO_003528 [Verrucomicrobiales bacterium]|jgi:hypothetical protein